MIRFGVPDLPQTLHPLYATDALSARVSRLLYLPLVDFDDRQKPVPVLADWEILAPRHYRFRLRADLPAFSDGTSMTATDVEETYRFVLDPVNASPLRGALAVLASVQAVDDSTVDFRLRRPDVHLPAYLTLGIVPAHALAGGASRNEPPPGNGPFVSLGLRQSTTLRLRRLADGQHVELIATRDPVVRVLKLLRGEIQILQNDLPPELFAFLEETGDIDVIAREGTNFTYLGLNLEDPVTADIRVRTALAHAIDRRAIAEHVFRGRIRPANALFAPEHWLGAGLTGYSYDPERARGLLAEAGYGHDNPLRLSYKTSSDPFRLRLAAIIQAQLAETGVEVQINSHDWGTFYGDIKNGNFQLYSLSWVGLKTPDSFRYLFHSESLPPAGANRGRYRSPRADALIERAESAADPADQVPTYRELQRVLLDELPYIPLWYEHHVVGHRSEVTGYGLAGDGNYDGLADIRWTN